MLQSKAGRFILLDSYPSILGCGVFITSPQTDSINHKDRKNDSTMSDSTTKLPIAIISSQDEAQCLEVANLISEAFGQPCECLSLDSSDTFSNRPLLLIDCSCFSPNRIQAWLKEVNDNHMPPVALYNTEPESMHESLLEWPCIRGFFYKDTAPQQLIDGLRLLLMGDFWVPRRLLHSYLERNRRPPTKGIKAASMLTKREREILMLLENGATNAAMASAMKVSEHTIKTHLYNIYKKIDATNRIEAINWSRQNISAAEQVESSLTND